MSAMPVKTYIITIVVEVNDEAALAEEARSQSAENGLMVDAWRDLRKEAPVEADLMMIFDPGVSPPGTSIIDSDVAQERAL